VFAAPCRNMCKCPAMLPPPPDAKDTAARLRIAVAAVAAPLFVNARLGSACTALHTRRGDQNKGYHSGLPGPRSNACRPQNQRHLVL
jgi:hypothetical protein